MLASTKTITPSEATQGQEATVWFGNGSGQGGQVAEVNRRYLVLQTPLALASYPLEKFTSGEYQLEVNDPLDRTECIEYGDTECSGEVDYRASLSGTGTMIKRCLGHWLQRLDLQEQIEQRYPTHAPADFDPSYAGESWDED